MLLLQWAGSRTEERNPLYTLMRSIELPGGPNAVLLLHGLQGSPTEMLTLAKSLQKAGYSVRIPHFQGYGYTTGDTAHSVTPWHDWRAQALAHLREMSKQYAFVAIGGLCIGAVLALSVAEEASAQISGLALLSTTLYYDGWSIPWYRFLLPLGYYTPLRYIYAYREREPYGLKNEQLRRWVAREMEHKTSSIAGASMLTLPAIHEAELMIKSVRRNLYKISAPALIIHAAEDDVSTLRSAELVAAHIGSDQVHKIILHDSYHMITMDNERALVANATIKFFDDLSKNRVPVNHVADTTPLLTLIHAS